MGFFGDMVSAVTGAIAKVANVVNAVVNAISGALSSLASAVSEVVDGAEAMIADACEDLEEDSEELLEESYKLLVGAYIEMFDSGSAGAENESANNEKRDKYRINKGESGNGFWGKIADAWVSSPIYNGLASMAEWQDEHPNTTEVLSIATIFMKPGSSESINGVEKESVIESKSMQMIKGVGNTDKGLPTKIPYEFMNDTADHIFNGVVKNAGTADEYATGWHYMGSGISNGNKIIQITRNADEFGTIEAKVEIGGVTKNGISTLFSDKYTPNEVADMIKQAHMNKILVPGSRGLYRGVADNGMTIEMYLYRNPEGCNISDVITAYPVHTGTLK